MKRYLILVIAVYGGLLIGCKNKEIQYHLITNQTQIDAVTIKMGSYFIYRDSVTGIVDSLYMREEFYVGSGTQEDDYNYYQFMQYRPRDKSFRGFLFRLGGTSWTMDKIYGVYDGLNGEFFNDINFLTLPFNEGATDNHYEYNWKYIKHYDSVSINNTPYRNVYETETFTDKWKFRSFYSLDNGLVKFITQTDSSYHSWSLIKSVIIR